MEHYVKTHEHPDPSKWCVKVREVSVHRCVVVKLEEEVFLVIPGDQDAIRIKGDIRVVLVPGEKKKGMKSKPQ